MSEYHLVGHHVRVVWKDVRPGGGKAETTIFRGQALHKDDTGLWLWGRFFLEKADTLSIREFPKEKDTDLRMYFAPWTSIDSVEIIGEKVNYNALNPESSLKIEPCYPKITRKSLQNRFQQPLSPQTQAKTHDQAPQL